MSTSQQRKVFVPETREEWLAERPKFLGGSELATVMGLNPYQSPYQLWLVKTGKEPSFKGNEATHFGHLLEESVANEFHHRTGHRVIKASAQDKIYFHPDYPFLGGTPDRDYFPVINGHEVRSDRRVLECKTTRKQVNPDIFMEDFKHWFIQPNFYGGIRGGMDFSVAWLTAYFGFDYDYLEFEFDKDVFDLSVQAGHHFWTENVMKDIPPDVQTVDDVLHQFASHVPGKMKEVDERMFARHQELAVWKAKKKEAEKEVTKLEDSIKLEYEDYEGLTFNGKTISTWKAGKGRAFFDKKAFESDYPEIFRKYVRTVPGSRSFLNKLK